MGYRSMARENKEPKKGVAGTIKNYTYQAMILPKLPSIIYD